MEKRIEQWMKEGLIDEKTAAQMQQDIKAEKEKLRKTKINILIYTIAVILIGTGVITFISANDWLLELLNSNNILKITLMTLITIASFFGGYILAYEKKNFPKLGNALIFLSSILIGGTYALIGQIYNINANSASLMFLWMISILPLAYLFKSKAINIVSIILAILGIIYFYENLALDKGYIWTVFIPVLSGIMFYSIGNIHFILNKYNDFSLSYKITGALPIFITLLVLTCSVEKSYHIISAYYIIPIVLLILLNLINFSIQKNKNMLLKIETFSLITFLILLLLLLTLPGVSVPFVMIMANLFIIAMIFFGFNYGYKFENIHIIGTANWMLIIYLTVNYCRWGWSFMDKSLFFLLGGICLLTLGLYLEKKRKTVIKK